ncbi:hypothetical protein RvY_01834 [Ramazzottius varieornatus]|uniref:CABIT domain-containing protein n=1 Tax=Ramazzottius varieornatus TaxID=947166 RepID=A0A1D1ULJ0_RAMVA|nr:hypothetical protein RvY_01834 [Ramazzottius varieornatus]
MEPDWDDKTVSVGQIKREANLLPCIAKIDCEERVESNAEIDLRQPLLLFKAYKSVKVQARLLYRHKVNRKDIFQPYGNVSLVIPKGYTGLFSILDKEGYPTAKCYMFINDLIKVTGQVSASFLIHNCTIQAYRRISRRHYRRVALPAGTILKTTGLFTDQTPPSQRPLSQASYCNTPMRPSFSFAKFFSRHLDHYDVSTSSSSISNEGSTTAPLTRETTTERSFLKCQVAMDDEIYIPLTTAGKFFLISDPARTVEFNKHCIHLLSTVISEELLPCRAKLICGFLPEMREHFTGYLQLETIQTCDVMLVCTMKSHPFQLFEVDTTSEFEFRTALLSNPRYLSTSFRAALAFVSAHCESWRKQVKIVHEVQVDAAEEEEEHIYAEIDGPDTNISVPCTSSSSSPGGSSGVSSRFSDETFSSTETTPYSDSSLEYRMHVLSFPSKLSFV